MGALLTLPTFEQEVSEIEPDRVVLRIDLRSLIGIVNNVEIPEHYNHAIEGTTALTASGQLGAISVPFPLSGEIMAQSSFSGIIAFVIAPEVEA